MTLQGAALDKVPVSNACPLAEYVRSQPNRNQWLIAAIAKQVEEEKQSSQNASIISTLRRQYHARGTKEYVKLLIWW